MYRIVKILNSENVVINAGSDDSITMGMVLEIFTPGEQVRDPVNQQVLGTLEIVKAKITPYTIQTKMSVCRGWGFSKMQSSIVAITQAFVAPATELNVDPSHISGGFEGKDYLIRVGDSVRVVRDNSIKELPPGSVDEESSS